MVPMELFSVDDVRARSLDESCLPALQQFFFDNPEYFLTVNGLPVQDNDARQEFEDRPPPGMPYDRIHLIGFARDDGQLLAMASVIENFLAPRVWHIGLFIVASSLHGRGVGRGLYAGMESWMRGQRAQWVRLGAVAGNAKAERFWERQGYVEVRRREGVQLGALTHTVRVLVKPVSAQGMDEYLGLVARDRKDAP